MIRSCGDKETEKLLQRRLGTKFAGIEKSAQVRHELLDAVRSLNDLKLPGLRLEALRGNRRGQFIIRINFQYRICFKYFKRDAYAIEIADLPPGRTCMPGSKKKRLKLIHPGEVLQEVLDEAGLTVNALALALRIPANRIGAIVKGQRGITADTALRLARYFRTSAQISDESPGEIRIGCSRRLLYVTRSSARFCPGLPPEPLRAQAEI